MSETKTERTKELKGTWAGRKKEKRDTVATGWKIKKRQTVGAPTRCCRRIAFYADRNMTLVETRNVAGQNADSAPCPPFPSFHKSSSTSSAWWRRLIERLLARVQRPCQPLRRRWTTLCCWLPLLLPLLSRLHTLRHCAHSRLSTCSRSLRMRPPLLQLRRNLPHRLHGYEAVLLTVAWSLQLFLVVFFFISLHALSCRCGSFYSWRCLFSLYLFSSAA